MSLPYFFIDLLNNSSLILNEDTSKHMISVLRMQKGEEVLLTDGKGTKARSVIVDDNRKRCKVDIIFKEQEDKPKRKNTIAISITKNASRFEWFLEKATETGISGIIPLVCERTEKQKFRYERMQQVMISAMLQSQQCWLPVLHEPMPFNKTMELEYDQKLIAHCLPDQKKALNEIEIKDTSNIILIGPEGDFTPVEIEKAMENNFIAVKLGNTRLRTETAGMVAAVIFSLY